ncbi:hydantoinase/oxoprolinase N-terminal domain-containing protein [Pseudonocardia sp. CA-142604]|uniref:hydantoinase/oxoprolinase N-terminal domain-containing protein n=1 Tax=Pseudonocardia sp. CA-142604 TaxID=3240024 RepID=UPI003D93EB3F
MTRRIRIGIDTRGTFTDVVAFDEEALVTAKTRSTPGNPADGRPSPPCGGVWAVVLQDEPDRALAAAGEHQGVPGQLVDHSVQVVDRAALLLPAQVRRGGRLGQPPVAGPAAGRTSRWVPAGSGTSSRGPGRSRLGPGPNAVRTPTCLAASAKRTTP